LANAVESQLPVSIQPTRHNCANTLPRCALGGSLHFLLTTSLSCFRLFLQKTKNMCGRGKKHAKGAAVCTLARMEIKNWKITVLNVLWERGITVLNVLWERGITVLNVLWERGITEHKAWPSRKERARSQHNDIQPRLFAFLESPPNAANTQSRLFEFVLRHNGKCLCSLKVAHRRIVVGSCSGSTYVFTRTHKIRGIEIITGH
jgi:hypothetical protein